MGRGTTSLCWFSHRLLQRHAFISRRTIDDPARNTPNRARYFRCSIQTSIRPAPRPLTKGNRAFIFYDRVIFVDIRSGWTSWTFNWESFNARSTHLGASSVRQYPVGTRHPSLPFIGDFVIDLYVIVHASFPDVTIKEIAPLGISCTETTSGWKIRYRGNHESHSVYGSQIQSGGGSVLRSDSSG